LPILEVASQEYLQTRNNSQIKADFIDYLRMAHEGIPNTISTIYHRLAASTVPEKKKPGQKPERRELHTFKINDHTDLTVVFLNMLEVLSAEGKVKKEIPWIQLKASRMKILQDMTYIQIGKELGCNRVTIRQYVDRVLTLIVDQVKTDARREKDREVRPVPADWEGAFKKYQQAAPDSSEAIILERVRAKLPAQLKPAREAVPRSGEKNKDGCSRHPNCLTCPFPDCRATQAEL
jgi:DNA-directed RNA polymerase specialized sigma24 family protein